MAKKLKVVDRDDHFELVCPECGTVDVDYPVCSHFDYAQFYSALKKARTLFLVKKGCVLELSTLEDAIGRGETVTVKSFNHETVYTFTSSGWEKTAGGKTELLPTEAVLGETAFAVSESLTATQKMDVRVNVVSRQC